MVAERALGLPQPRRHAADERDLGVGHERVRSRPRAAPEPAAGDERGQHQLRHVLGQRSDRRQHQRRRSAQENGDGQALAARLGRPRSGSRRPCRSASACRSSARRGPAGGTCPDCCGPDRRSAPQLRLADARGRCGPAFRVLRVDERQRDERPAVLRPAGQHRQPVEPHVLRHDLGHRPGRPLRARSAAPPPPRRARPRAWPASAAAASRPARRGAGSSRPGRRPKASSARRAVPNRLVTSGSSAPRTRVNSSAGPPAAITRRWISAASSRASTSASTTHSSPSLPELVQERAQVGEAVVAHVSADANGADRQHRRPRALVSNHTSRTRVALHGEEHRLTDREPECVRRRGRHAHDPLERGLAARGSAAQRHVRPGARDRGDRDLEDVCGPRGPRARFARRSRPRPSPRR